MSTAMKGLKYIRIDLIFLFWAAVNRSFSQCISQKLCESHLIGRSIFHEDPAKIYICISAGNAIEMTCETGKGFNGYECVHWSKYPCKGGTKPQCLEGEMSRPWKHEDPNKFWVCKSKKVPVEVSCPSGTGFMDFPGNTGCVPWERYRCMDKN